MSFSGFSERDLVVLFRRHNYFHHSKPSNPDGFTFYQKCIVRPALKAAQSVIADKRDGDKKQAQHLIDLHGVYIDGRGKQQSGDKPVMCAGRAAEDYCTDILVNDANPADAYSDAVNYLHGFHGGSWRNAATDKREIDHKLNPRYTTKGTVPKKDADHCELELVCRNALDGLREAMAGANRITGQKKLTGKFDDVELRYLGYADYQEGGVELKTKWDRRADSDKPSANSLPNEITFDHLMQIAGYWHITEIMPTIVYANRLGYRVFKPSLEQLQAGVTAIVEACRRRERLLAAAPTTEELLRLCDPQWEHAYLWKGMAPELVDQAHKIWRA
jgi:hypothetical protein